MLLRRGFLSLVFIFCLFYVAFASYLNLYSDNSDVLVGEQAKISVYAEGSKISKIYFYSKGSWKSSSCDLNDFCRLSFFVDENKQGLYTYYAIAEDAYGRRFPKIPSKIFISFHNKERAELLPLLSLHRADFSFEKALTRDASYDISYYFSDYVMGFSISMNIKFWTQNSWIRIILEDYNGTEYLVYEATPVTVRSARSFFIPKACEETCILKPIWPKRIKFEIRSAKVEVKRIHYIPKVSLSNIPKELLEKFFKIYGKKATYIEKSIKAKNINTLYEEKKVSWKARVSALSLLPYEIKKRKYGSYATAPNLLEYYACGSFNGNTFVPCEAFSVEKNREIGILRECGENIDYYCCNNNTAVCWQDECGDSGIFENCSSDEVCEEGSCIKKTCEITERFCCSGNSVCYKDSCGNTGFIEECPENSICENGQCVKVQEVYKCRDSDGKNIKVGGQVAIEDYYGKVIRGLLDYCIDETTVAEYVCSKSSVESYDKIDELYQEKRIKCESGYVCDVDRCVEKSTVPGEETYYCQDEDGEDTSIASWVKIYNNFTGELVESHIDYCINENTVAEYVCSSEFGNNAKSIFTEKAISCGEGYKCEYGKCVKEQITPSCQYYDYYSCAQANKSKCNCLNAVICTKDSSGCYQFQECRNEYCSTSPTPTTTLSLPEGCLRDYTSCVDYWASAGKCDCKEAISCKWDSFYSCYTFNKCENSKCQASSPQPSPTASQKPTPKPTNIPENCYSSYENCQFFNSEKCECRLAVACEMVPSQDVMLYCFKECHNEMCGNCPSTEVKLESISPNPVGQGQPITIKLSLSECIYHYRDEYGFCRETNIDGLRAHFQVYDSSGKSIYTSTMYRNSCSTNLTIKWNGFDSAGNALSPGSYSFTIKVKLAGTFITLGEVSGTFTVVESSQPPGGTGGTDAYYCYDEDGFNFYKNSRIIIKNSKGEIVRVLHDGCSSNSRVSECVCLKASSNTLDDLYRCYSNPCASGEICDNGRCTKGQPTAGEYTCEDFGDGGYDIYVKGGVHFYKNGKSFSKEYEICTSSGKVMELDCVRESASDPEALRERYTVECPPGYVCSGGACVKSESSGSYSIAIPEIETSESNDAFASLEASAPFVRKGEKVIFKISGYASEGIKTLLLYHNEKWYKLACDGEKFCEKYVSLTFNRAGINKVYGYMYYLSEGNEILMKTVPMYVEVMVYEQ